jgi:NADH:ubiquinone oxidoreductase subunit D
METERFVLDGGKVVDVFGHKIYEKLEEGKTYMTAVPIKNRSGGVIVPGNKVITQGLLERLGTIDLPSSTIKVYVE